MLNNAIYKKLFTLPYTEAQFVIDFTARFPELVPITNSAAVDVTATVLPTYLYTAILLLPEGMVSYFNFDNIQKIVMFMTAHHLAYANIRKNNGGADAYKNLVRLAASQSADGLSISYVEIAHMHGDAFASLTDWLNTTYYGRIVIMFIEKMNGSVGVYAA